MIEKSAEKKFGEEITEFGLEKEVEDNRRDNNVQEFFEGKHYPTEKTVVRKRRREDGMKGVEVKKVEKRETTKMSTRKVEENKTKRLRIEIREQKGTPR